jgi:hypothetical protein
MGVSSANTVHRPRGGLGGILLLASACIEDDDPFDALAGAASASMRVAEPALRGCDGTALPDCVGAFTGAACDLPCRDGAAECGIDRTCHSDGATYGLSVRNAILYAASPEDPDEVVHADFEAWIVEHAADIGLDAGLSVDDVELTRLENFRSSAGPLTLFRFAQTYHGLPVLAPDGIVTLVYAPRGAVAVTGAIIDGRTPYAHREVQAPEAQAVRSMLVHASARSGVPADALEVVHATPVAMPMQRAIGWTGFVRRAGGSPFARVIVDADPSFRGAALPLWSYRELAVAGLGDTEPIEVRGVDISGDLTTLGHANHTMLTTGAPLLGSVDDVSLEIQLATERVVLLDLHDALEADIPTSATRVLDPSGAFLADAGSEVGAQAAYHLFQGWYDFIDGRLTDPTSGAKRWDSANLLYSDGNYPSDTPPGTYSPRVLAFVDANAAECPANAVACALASGYVITGPQAMAFPELAHIPPGATNQETTGTMRLLGEAVQPITFAHEFGHIIDLFTGGGIIERFAPDCGGACTLECVEDTTDEAPPLTESIAQLLAFVFLHQSFDGVGWGHCSIVDMVSRNGSNPWTPGACIPAGEDISLFQRPGPLGPCPKPSAYCDKPEDPGVTQHCCFDDEDLSQCTLILPVQCPAGAPGPTGGMGTGTARAVPTGLCERRQGYATNSLFQAFWQLLNGQRCDPAPPFACTSVSWGPGVDPMDATTDALLYALRVNALTYEQLFAGMATYVSCTYGAAAYGEFNTVVCNHGLRDCAAPAPLTCETCGNEVREGTEECDGSDWLHTRCEDLPQYSGGTLTCDPTTCLLDESQCVMPALDTTATTAGTAIPDESTTTPSTGFEADTEAEAAGSNPDGCGCRARGAISGWLVLPLSWLGARRRRRSA